MRIAVTDATIVVTLPEGWLAEHPLTEAEIMREAEYLATAGFSLQYA
jgi:hypothetical protein